MYTWHFPELSFSKPAIKNSVLISRICIPTGDFYSKYFFQLLFHTRLVINIATSQTSVVSGFMIFCTQGFLIDLLRVIVKIIFDNQKTFI